MTWYSGFFLLSFVRRFVTLANLQKFGFEFHLRSSSSAFSGHGWSVDQLITSLLATPCWRYPTRSKQLSTVIGLKISFNFLHQNRNVLKPSVVERWQLLKYTLKDLRRSLFWMHVRILTEMPYSLVVGQVGENCYKVHWLKVALTTTTKNSSFIYPLGLLQSLFSTPTFGPLSGWRFWNGLSRDGAKADSSLNLNSNCP